MTRHRVLLSSTAVAQLGLLDDRRAKGIKDALHRLEDGPFRPRSGVDIKKLAMSLNPPLFRLRLGDYRVIYFITDREVRVTEIIHQSKGYKWLG